MTQPSPDTIPVLASMEGLESLNITPEEAFVLSRINGTSSLKEIAQILGFDPAKVWSLLERLVTVGAVQLNEPKEKAPARRRSGGPRSLIEQLDEEDQQGDLSRFPRSKRNEIMLRYQALANQTHYEVLGVPKRASADAIKKKYFELVKEFHPDKFYSLPLGHYKGRLEELFKRITMAFDELSNPTRRAIYDESLDGPPVPEGTKAGGAGPKGNTMIEKLAQAKRYFEMGAKEEKQGKEISAANFYQLAHNLAPTEKDIERAWIRMKPIILRRKSEEVFARGVHAYDMGDSGNAIVLLEEALEMNPRKKECYRYLAALHARNKSTLARAKECALRAVDFFPQESEAHSTLGLVYKQLGEDKLALKEFQLALKLDKTNEAAKHGLASLKG